MSRKGAVRAEEFNNEILSPANYSQVPLNPSTDAGGRNSPSLIKIFHLLSVAICCPRCSCSPGCRVLQVHLFMLLSEKGVFLPLAARWCCRIGKCISARLLRARARSGHCCWRTEPPLPMAGSGSRSCWSMGAPGGPGGRRAGEPRQHCGGLWVASNLHQSFLPRENQLTGDQGNTGGNSLPA